MALYGPETAAALLSLGSAAAASPAAAAAAAAAFDPVSFMAGFLPQQQHPPAPAILPPAPSPADAPMDLTKGPSGAGGDGDAASTTTLFGCAVCGVFGTDSLDALQVDSQRN